MKTYYTTDKIIAESVDDAFNQVLDALAQYGIESSPRGMKITELINCNIVVLDPRKRIVSCPQRRFSGAYAFGELVWYLSARNDLAFMDYYSAQMKRNSDDGLTLNSAYGYRIFGHHKMIPFDQWENAKRLLREDKDTRQAIIHLHTPNNQKTKDEVCTLTLQFIIRENKLDLIVNMRSNDLVLGFTYDAFSFTMLQEMMAIELGVELGYYFHNAGSMHIYERNYFLLKNHTYSRYADKVMNRMPQDVEKLGDYKKHLISLEASLKRISADSDESAIRFLIDREFTGIVDDSYLLAFSSFLLRVVEKVAKNKVEQAELSNKLLNKLVEHGKEEMATLLAGQCKCFTAKGRKIIVEGIDKVGKSTYIESLIKDNPEYERFYLRHFNKPSESYSYYDDYVANIDSPIDAIWDRSFISEIVYGKVFRNNVELSTKQFEILCAKLREKDVQIVLILPENLKEIEIIASRMKNSEDDALIDKIRALNDVYRVLSATLAVEGLNVVNLNVQGQGGELHGI